MMSSRSSAASSRDDAVSSHSMKVSKICGVCSDVARCYHFGGLCCASCKAFFRRAVVNDQYKPYRCVYGGSCGIDVTTRKHCSHCRLKRCLSIGMDKKWFMSEEMRAELKLKTRKKLINSKQVLLMDPRPFALYREHKLDGRISSEQIREIHALVQLCRIAYHSNLIPDETRRDKCPPTTATTAIIFSVVIRRVFCFLSSVPQLQHLDPVTQMFLLKERGMEALIVLSALTFNPVRRMWCREQSTLLMEPCPIHVCSEDFEKLHGAHLARRHLDTIVSLLNLNADEHIIILLSLVAFFTLDDQYDIVDSQSAAQSRTIQEHFIELLKLYIQWKFIGDVSEKIFARYILKLSDVREVHNLHKVTKLSLSNEDIHQVEKQMGGLDLLKFAQ